MGWTGGNASPSGTSFDGLSAITFRIYAWNTANAQQSIPLYFDNFILSGVNVVPEPVNVALGIFGVLLGGLALARYHAAKRRSVLQPQA